MEGRMGRLRNCMALVLFASLAGCGGSNNNNNMNMGDMAVPPMVDMAMKEKDMTMLAVTGAPCKASTDCAPSMAPGNAKGTCTKSNMLGGHVTPWPDGYCQASCRPSKNDASGINNTDCSGDTPVCAGSGSSGTCYAACTSVADCRDEYVC